MKNKMKEQKIITLEYLLNQVKKQEEKELKIGSIPKEQQKKDIFNVK